MKILRVIGIVVGVLAAVTMVPLYDQTHTVQTIKDEVKALRSFIPMRHPENKSIVIRVGKYKSKKAKPKKIGKYILKLNNLRGPCAAPQ
jgi:hypothetical protein